MELKILSTRYMVEVERERFRALEEMEQLLPVDDWLSTNLEKITGVSDVDYGNDMEYEDYMGGVIHLSLYKELDNPSTHQQILETIEKHLKKADEWVANTQKKAFDTKEAK